MQLVGATKRFIQRPFIWKHLQLGLLGALLACGSMSFLLFKLNERFPELNLLERPEEAGLIFFIIIMMGVVITAASTFFATQRFLNLTTDAVN